MLKQLLDRITCSNRIKELEEEKKRLEMELEKRQEAINKTNAYWKRKYHELDNRLRGKKKS